MNRLRQWLSDILAAPGLLRDAHRKLDRILRNQEKIMATQAELNESVDALEAAVAADATVDGSAKTLLERLIVMIEELKVGGGDPAAMIARINALASTLRANQQVLADAVLVNTPAAP